MNSRFLVNFAAAIEALTGLAMLVVPALVIGMLLGDGLGQTGVVVTRVLGIALLSVGVAGWESHGQCMRLAPRAGLCVYNVGVAIVFLTIGIADEMHGMLLWPAALLHAAIGAAMLAAFFR